MAEPPLKSTIAVPRSFHVESMGDIVVYKRIVQEALFVIPLRIVVARHFRQFLVLIVAKVASTNFRTYLYKHFISVEYIKQTKLNFTSSITGVHCGSNLAAGTCALCLVEYGARSCYGNDCGLHRNKTELTCLNKGRDYSCTNKKLK